ncbi:MAG: carbamoylphosphate synthase large subunit [Candidatus Sericytochromatia bacterium]|nr:carbamoylphosphate synthase large subunit [Candidatus Sericytochromatia bacterium]
MPEDIRTSKTVLLTGGRAPVALELARLFHAAGHRVVLAESFAYPLGRFSRAVAKCYRVPPPNPDPEAFLTAVADLVVSERVDLLIPTCEEVFHLARGAAQLGPDGLLFAPPWSLLRDLHSKWEFIRRAEAHGFEVPATRKLCSRQDLVAWVDGLPLGRRLVLKPVYSRFATKVHCLVVGQPLPEVVPSAAEPWVVQDFVEGRAICTYGIAREGRLVAHAAYAADFTAGQGACINFAPLEHAGLLSWVRRFVDEESLTGQLAFDFIETSDGRLLPLECNPRATSGVHLFSATDRLDLAFLDGGTLRCPSPRTTAMLGVAMFAYGLPAVRSLARFKQWLAVVARSRDVVFRWSDPLPFFTQFVAYGAVLRASRRSGLSPLEVTTRDIEWNG